MKITTVFAIVSLSVLSTTTAAHADAFGTDPNNTFDIEFVSIGNPGNVADTTVNPVPNPPPPHATGSVASTYRIGKFEISEAMIDKANAETAATANPLSITHNNRGPNKPATSISWFEAAKFVNWLNTSSGSTPAYNFDGSGNFQLWESGDTGFNPNNLYRNSLATYFLPSVDQWYKAAYYDPVVGDYYDYPTGFDTAPAAVASGTVADTAVYDGQLGPADITLAGGLSPYGTMAQGGNVWEWEETDTDLVNDSTSSGRGIRGSSWINNSGDLLSSVRIDSFSPTTEEFNVGFRVASVIPEPSTLLLGALASLGLFVWRKR